MLSFATAALLASSALLSAPVSAAPASLEARSAAAAQLGAPTQAAASITIPIHRRAERVKRDKADFARRVAAMKSRYGTPSTGKKTRRADAGSLSLTNYQDSQFYGAVSIGTPPVDYSLVLDTGSADLILAVDGCTGCEATTPGYVPTDSSTALASSTPFTITYGSGSASGTLAQDTVSIAGYTMEKQVFAACTDLENVADGSISGILGLGWKSIASSGATPLVENLAETGALPSQVFGFAFKSYAYDKLTSDTMPGGTLTLGGTDTSAYEGAINWIPISLPGGYWSIPLEGVTVGGVETGVKATETVIDTGTTLIGAPTADVEAIYAQIPAATPYSLDGESGYFSMPCNTQVNVTMTFGGIEYAIPADSFNAGAVDTAGRMCLGAIFALETTSSISWIVGDAFLTGVYSAFRFDDKPAVGFAQLGSGGEAVASTTGKTTTSAGTSPAAGLSSLLSKSSVGAAVLATVAAAALW